MCSTCKELGYEVRKELLINRLSRKSPENLNILKALKGKNLQTFQLLFATPE